MSMFLPVPLAVPARRLALAATIAVCAAPAVPTTASSDIAATARYETIAREAFQRWAAGASIFPTLLALDVVETIPGSGPVADTYQGLADFVERASQPLVRRLATPLVPQVHHVWAVGDRVIVRFDASATTKAGQPYNNQFVWIFWDALTCRQHHSIGARLAGPRLPPFVEVTG